MSNEVIKKTRVLAANLPAVNAETITYDVRYRIISEDKNLYSHWSPIISVNPGYSYTTGNISIVSNSGATNVSWDAVTIKIGTNVIRQAKDYDVWVKWSKQDGLGDWIHKERVSGGSIGLVHPSTYFIDKVDQAQAPNRITVEIFLAGNPTSRDYTGLRVYSPAIHTI